MFSTLSHYWNRIQENLFPHLRQELPDFEAHHEKVSGILAIVKVEEFIDQEPVKVGRNKKDRQAIARAFVTKAALNTGTTLELIRQLKYDHALRIICGWEYYDQVPSESTFSRAFNEFSHSQLPEKVHNALVKAVYEDRRVMHISRDATDIPAREKSKVKKVSQEGKKGGPRSKFSKTQLQLESGLGYDDLLSQIPCLCDSGKKVSPKGTALYWMGYKFHVDVADGYIPISCALTSASVNDTMLAIPLSIKSRTRVQAFYELMDKGYTSKAVEQFIREGGRVPIIEKKACTTRQKEELQLERIALSTLNWRYPERIRLDARTTAEGFFSRLKDVYGGRNIRVKGGAKVFCHLMFGVLAATAEQLIRLLE